MTLCTNYEYSSVAVMESSGVVSTDALPKPKETINVLTGIFLKMVFFLDHDLMKCVITGIFKDREDSLGVLFKGKKGVYFGQMIFSISSTFPLLTMSL